MRGWGWDARGVGGAERVRRFSLLGEGATTMLNAHPSRLTEAGRPLPLVQRIPVEPLRRSTLGTNRPLSPRCPCRPPACRSTSSPGSSRCLPIVVLLVLLAVRRWTAPQAGPVGMFAAAAVAYFVLRTPVETLAVASAKGIWDAIFILYVVWAALLLYLVTERAGGYDALRLAFTRFSRDELFIVVALGWVFSSFLQGVAGFGAPIAIVAPLLVAYGVRPIYAVALPIIAHIWAKMFGTLAVGWLATIQVVDLANGTATAFQSAILLIIPAVLGGFTVIWMYGRWPAVRHGWPLVLIISAIQGGVQLGMTLVDPVLSAFVAGTVALIALYPLSRWEPVLGACGGDHRAAGDARGPGGDAGDRGEGGRGDRGGEREGDGG